MIFEHSDILAAMQAKFQFDLSQWPQVGELVRRTAQQIRAGHPTEHWGYFAHGGGREDVLGVESGGRKYGWDVVVSAGSTVATLNLAPDTQDLTDHEFRVLDAKDWFAEAPDPPPPPPPPLDPPADAVLVAMLTEALLKLARLEDKANKSLAILEHVEARCRQLGVW
ncbi:MAG TPA: hypothetical protein VMY35_11425 [Phycisphaerae bacterium]|nr:hypothetical protein [Phycisphaerae bacterium]